MGIDICDIPKNKDCNSLNEFLMIVIENPTLW